MPDVAPEQQTADTAGDGAPKESAPVEQVREPRVRKLNIIGRRNLFFAISLLIIIPGILSMATKGFLLGIDFAGGTEFTVTFTNHPSLTQVENAVAAENDNGSVIQTGGGGFILRYPPLTVALQKQVEDDLQSRLGLANFSQVLEVGGTIAGETIEFALLA
ncbi:MAG: hypothetical protein WB682_01845, partial [Candidatus Dormiibacterota bacterium]